MFFSKKNKVDKGDIKKAGENLRKGSAEAFHMLYDSYNKKVYRFCLRMMGDESQAKDAFQETFIKVFENKKNFRGENFGAWLFTIARHTCLNLIRKRKEHDSFDEFYHGQDTAKVSDIGAKDYIEKSISELPVPLREVILLREYEEYSYKEISEILGIDLSLAKVRVHRARLVLRKALKPIIKELNESR